MALGKKEILAGVSAVAAVSTAAAFYFAAARVPFLTALFDSLGRDTYPAVAFYYTRWDTAVTPGLWLRVALGVAVPAVVVAGAAARLAPAVATRLAGVLSQRAVVYLVIAGGVAAVAWAAVYVSGDRAVDLDESTFLFQSKIFARGRLAATAPDTEGDLDHAFFRAKTEVVRGGRWFAIYPPLHPALLTLAAKVGWPKVVGVAAAALILFLTYSLANKTMGRWGAALTAVLVASSPFFIFVQGSYLSEATFLAFVACGAYGCWVTAADARGGWRAAVTLGAGAGAAFLARDYGALYVALPLAWFVGRGAGARGGWKRWTGGAVAAAPFVAAWVLYNWRQTGNPFLPPRFFSTITHFGFDAVYTPATALSSWARNIFVLSTDGFGWPLVGLVPVGARIFMKPRPDNWEKALYGIILFNFVAQFPVRNVGISYGARYYYVAWWAGTFLTARFFVILGAWAAPRFRGAGEGAAAAVLAALVAINLVFYMPRAAARYGDRPWGNYSLWADEGVRAALAALEVRDAVVVLKPRDWCLSSVPGSPFLDDDIIYARDAGDRNKELKRLFPGRSIYAVDYGRFRRTGEVVALERAGAVK